MRVTIRCFIMKTSHWESVKIVIDDLEVSNLIKEFETRKLFRQDLKCHGPIVKLFKEVSGESLYLAMADNQYIFKDLHFHALKTRIPYNIIVIFLFSKKVDPT